MNTKLTTIDRLIEPLAGCLNEASARKLVSMKPDRQLQKRVDELSRKSTDGTLTEDELAEYSRYVAYGTFISTLKSRARLLIAQSRASL